MRGGGLLFPFQGVATHTLQEAPGEGGGGVGRRTNWELALHLGQFINWIMGSLRPQAHPKEASLPSPAHCRVLGTKTQDLSFAESSRSWELLNKSLSTA